MNKPLIACAVLAALSLTTLASADDKQNTYVDKTTKDGQDIIFKDDPMSAGVMDPNGLVLTIRPSAARMQLLRPRTQFITQMLKSVENL
jgi:hypothetical protein